MSLPVGGMTPGHPYQRVQARRGPGGAAAGVRGGKYKGTGSRAPKALLHANELDAIEDSLLFKLLKPIIVCMQVFGMYYARQRVSHTGRLVDVLRGCSAQQIYCISMNIILFVNFIRSLTAFGVSELLNCPDVQAYIMG